MAKQFWTDNGTLLWLPDSPGTLMYSEECCCGEYYLFNACWPDDIDPNRLFIRTITIDGVPLIPEVGISYRSNDQFGSNNGCYTYAGKANCPQPGVPPFDYECIEEKDFRFAFTTISETCDECHCDCINLPEGYRFEITGITNGFCPTCDGLNGIYDVPLNELVGLISVCGGQRRLSGGFCSAPDNYMLLQWLYNNDPTAAEYDSELTLHATVGFLSDITMPTTSSASILKGTDCFQLTAANTTGSPFSYECNYNNARINVTPY